MGERRFFGVGFSWRDLSWVGWVWVKFYNLRVRGEVLAFRVLGWVGSGLVVYVILFFIFESV